MRAAIVSIGNSKGVRIPKILLEESGLGNDVEIKAKKGEIRITTVTSQKKPKITVNDDYLLSLNALQESNDPEEDKAWAHLQ